MANEAVIVYLNPNANPRDYTVASGTAIAKGTICKLTDPVTAAASDGPTNIFAGIAAAAKASNDDATTLALYEPGQGNVFDLYCAGGAIPAGGLVVISGVNTIKFASAAEIVSGMVIGKALEAAAQGTAETIEVLV